MFSVSVALALAALSGPTAASKPPLFVAVNAEKASGFASLAECERALGRRDGRRGSMFNRKAGNISRCEMVQGEPMIVIYPREFVTER